MEPFNGFFDGRSVLVVGADGFLGVNCVLALRAVGARVTVLSRRTEPRAASMADRVVRGEMTDPEVVRAAVEGQEIVFDFAGSSSPVRSNLLGTEGLHDECAPHLNVFAACARSARPPRVVFCSSRLVYGKPKYLPVDELHPLAPSCFYAANKLVLEHYLHALSRTGDLEYVIVRLSNPYGPHASPAGHSIINLFIQRARRGETLMLYGGGQQSRDYIFVDDAMDAFLRCAATPTCRNEVFNLGSGHTINLHDAAEFIAGRFGGRIQTVPWPADYQLIETGDYRTDLSKLRSFTDLPVPRSFDQGLAQVRIEAPQDELAMGVPAARAVTPDDRPSAN